MKLEQIEKEALKLSAEDRAKLVQELISSLVPTQQHDDWSDALATAQARARQIDLGEVETVSYASVMEKARALIRWILSWISFFTPTLKLSFTSALIIMTLKLKT